MHGDGHAVRGQGGLLGLRVQAVVSRLLACIAAGTQLNLLDTPGHQDFSEDTYRWAGMPAVQQGLRPHADVTNNKACCPVAVGLLQAWCLLSV